MQLCDCLYLWWMYGCMVVYVCQVTLAIGYVGIYGCIGYLCLWRQYYVLGFQKMWILFKLYLVVVSRQPQNSGGQKVLENVDKHF